jgi:hypothetical protein
LKGDGTRGRGFGFNRYKGAGSYCACVAEIEVDRGTGRVRVPRFYAAADAGLIINPDGLVNQVEGGIIQSASWTLMEEINFDRGIVTQRDWNAYPILKMPDVPKVEVTLINRPDMCGRDLAGPRRGRNRQRVCGRHRSAHPRYPVPSGAGEGCARLSTSRRIIWKLFPPAPEISGAGASLRPRRNVKSLAHSQAQKGGRQARRKQDQGRRQP